MPHVSVITESCKRKVTYHYAQLILQNISVNAYNMHSCPKENNKMVYA